MYDQMDRRCPYFFDIISNICQGRVTAFVGTELQRFTTYKAHPSTDGPIRQILTNDKGVVTLGPKNVHMASRKGATMWEIRCVGNAAFWTSVNTDIQLVTRI